MLWEVEVQGITTKQGWVRQRKLAQSLSRSRWFNLCWGGQHEWTNGRTHVLHEGWGSLCHHKEFKSALFAGKQGIAKQEKRNGPMKKRSRRDSMTKQSIPWLCPAEETHLDSSNHAIQHINCVNLGRYNLPGGDEYIRWKRRLKSH